MQNDKLETLYVGEEMKALRLDALMASFRPDLSRSSWKKRILRGELLVNGAAVKANYAVKPGETISWYVVEAEAETCKAEPIAFDVLYEDDVLLALAKPPGLVVHPGAGNPSGTLVNGLMHYDGVFDSVERGGVVHRLDKDTSGVMVVAKSNAVMEALQQQFKNRLVKKRYVAIVKGTPSSKRGRIETLIGRHPVQRKKMAVVNEGGRIAVSTYTIEETFDGAALVHVAIETGRTHQIRVHMAHVGCPVLGDAVYGRNRASKLSVKPARQMLHAEQLAITHPKTGESICFEAPLPADMQQILDGLRST